MQNTEGRKNNRCVCGAGVEGEIAASDSPSLLPRVRPFRSSSRLMSLIDSANLVKTIHYFTIMTATAAARAAPPLPSLSPSPSPRRGEQLTISAQTNDLAAQIESE